MRIRTKVTVALLFVSLLCAISVGIAASYSEYQALLTARGQAMRAVVSGQKSNVQHVFDGWQALGRSIASRTRLRALLRQHAQQPSDAALREIDTILSGAQQALSSSINALSICTDDGQLLLSTTTSVSPALCRISSDEHADDIQLRDVSLSADGRLSVTFSSAIAAQEPAMSRLLMSMDAAAILRITKNHEGLGQTGETVIAQPDDNGDAVFITPLRYSTGMVRVPKTSMNVPITHALLQRELEFSKGVATDYSGKQIIAATAFIPELGWGIVSKIDYDEALGPIRSRIAKIWQLTLLVCLAAVCVGIPLARSLTSPLLYLVSVAKAVASGDTDQKSHLRSKDEIGELSDTLNTMLDSLNERTVELEEFTYRTSHDLRAPLKSSRELVRLAQQSLQSDDAQSAEQALALAHKSLKKLDDLLADIMLLAKNKNVEEDKQPINFHTLIEGALDKLAYMDNVQRLDIRVEIDERVSLSAELSRMTLIVENLLSNAIKYQDLNREHSYLAIRVSLDDHCVVLAVEDNGLGLPTHQHDKLFKMFQRLHPKTAFGSGLGLYMTKKSALIMGGDMHFEPHPDKTIFKFIKHVG